MTETAYQKATERVKTLLQKEKLTPRQAEMLERLSKECRDYELVNSPNKEQFEAYSTRIEELLQFGLDNLTPEELSELDGLTSLAERYEDIHYPMPIEINETLSEVLVSVKNGDETYKKCLVRNKLVFVFNDTEETVGVMKMNDEMEFTRLDDQSDFADKRDLVDLMIAQSVKRRRIPSFRHFAVITKVYSPVGVMSPIFNPKYGNGKPHRNYSQHTPRTEPKVGRNDPCPCGSGKKYKKCHEI